MNGPKRAEKVRLTCQLGELFGGWQEVNRCTRDIVWEVNPAPYVQKKG